jgi:hypothetical protein
MKTNTNTRPKESASNEMAKDSQLIDDIESASQKISLEHPMASPQSNDKGGSVDVCLVIALLSSIVLLAFSGYFFMKSNGLTNEVVSALIPQPFTENNDFMSFHLPNRLKVLLVRPNQNLNQTYICSLISALRRHRL